MIWQDWVFAGGAVFFAVSLIPTVLDERSRVSRLTSVPTAVLLVAFAAAQWTLGLRVAPACEIVCALGWTFMAVRRNPRHLEDWYQT